MFSKCTFIKCGLISAVRFFALGAILFTSSINAGENTPFKPTILVSIKPVALLVKDIVGDSAEVHVLVEGQSSGHHFQLKISDKKRINQADLVVWVGPSLENFLHKPLTQRRKSGKLDIAIAQLLSDEREDTHVDKHQHFHSQQTHSGGDPHIWLNPNIVNKVSAHLSQRLIALYPANKNMYNTNSQNADKRLLGVFNQWLTHFSAKIELKGQNFIVFHDSMSHFVEAFALPNPSFMMQVPDQPVSAKQLSALKKQANQARCVVADVPEQRQAQKYAKKLGLPLITVDVLAAKYDQNTNFADYFNRFVQDFARCYKQLI